LIVSVPESNANHVAYKSGMSQWCANCHLDYLLSEHRGLSGFEHPADHGLENDIVTQYEIYNGTLDPTGATASSSSLAAVPFEDAGNTINGSLGPTPSSTVFCLTCHRAQASSGPRSGRWDFNVTSLGQDGVVSGSYALPNPYPDPNQDPLCYKCHESGSDRSAFDPNVPDIGQ